MKLILAQPSILRFQWELEVLLTNIRQFTDMEVVLLFKKEDDTVPRYLQNKYPGVRCFVYKDNRYDKSYIPSIRPYLWWQYLEKDASREQEDYFYIDSDVLFREWPNLDGMLDGADVVGSNCDGYIGEKYIRQCKRGPEIIDRMARICGITPQQMVGVPGIGAHILLHKPKASTWKKAYERSNDLWHYFDSLNSDIQKWTAEMWAQLWTWVEEEAAIEMPAELDFCWATDPIEKWDKVKIYHNSGVSDVKLPLFFKGKYTAHTPFGEDFSWVDKNKCSSEYVKAIKSVVI